MGIHSIESVRDGAWPEPQTLCEEIGEEVREMAIALFVGRLSPALFEQSVVALEAAKVKRFGFRLTAERLENSGSRFRLSDAETGRTCATLDFNPISETLEVHTACG